MDQQVFEDEYGVDVWDTTDSSRCFVHILNSDQYRRATGTTPPTKPPTAQEYSKAGLPWFDYYDETVGSLSGTKTLINLDSVATQVFKQGKGTMSDNGPIIPTKIVRLKGWGKEIREGKF